MSGQVLFWSFYLVGLTVIYLVALGVLEHGLRVRGPRD